MELYVGLLTLVTTAKVYATKTNKVKSLEICDIAENTLKNYTMEEFASLKSDKSPIGENPGITLKEKYHFLYVLTKEKLSNNDDSRLIELNQTLRSLSKIEEDELMDIITMTMSRPAEILYGFTI